MRDGVRITCGNGKQRWCFPILCEHIGDMEEQWLLTCLIKPSCPKYLNRYLHQSGTTVTTMHRVSGVQNSDSDSSHSYYLPTERTDKDARTSRTKFVLKDHDALQLKLQGYHQTPPYSHDYPFNGILDAVGPNLLHGVSKVFMDYVLEKWLYPLMKQVWCTEKGKKIEELDTELNARFALMPQYQGLRRFSNGIFSQKLHHWSVYEVVAIMKVIIGALFGLLPSEAFPLLKEYLHIHYISHYSVHTEESLE